MSGVFKALLNGHHTRGEGGFLYVKGEECAYLFPQELHGHAEATEALSGLLAESSSSVFYVAEERDGTLHLLAYPKEHVFRAVKEEMEKNRIEEV